MTSLAGKRVLLVEDEPVVAMHIEDMLLDLGCDVIGPCPRLSAGLEAARLEYFEVAVLDVNLNGEESYPVAEVLHDRSIPFIFATGFGERKTVFPEVPTLTKPYGSDQLEAALLQALASMDRT